MGIAVISPCRARPSKIGRGARQNFGRTYFNCDDIEEKVVLSFVPRPFTTVMMAIEMPAAIRPYSMAVAAVSSFRKALKVWIMARL